MLGLSGTVLTLVQSYRGNEEQIAKVDPFPHAEISVKAWKGRGPPLAVWAPRTRVCGDAHKKIRGKTVKGKSIFGIRNFPTVLERSE